NLCGDLSSHSLESLPSSFGVPNLLSQLRDLILPNRNLLFFKLDRCEMALNRHTSFLLHRLHVAAILIVTLNKRIEVSNHTEAFRCPGFVAIPDDGSFKSRPFRFEARDKRCANIATVFQPPRKAFDFLTGLIAKFLQKLHRVEARRFKAE